MAAPKILNGLGHNLPAKLEFLCNRLITAYIRGMKIIKKPPALTNHHQQTPT